MKTASSQPTEALILPIVLAAPVLVAFNTPPSTVLVNQLLASAGWGAVCALRGLAHERTVLRFQPSATLTTALGLLLMAVLWSWSQSLSTGRAWQVIGSLGMAGWLVVLASQPVAGTDPISLNDRHTFASAILVAATISAILAIIQIFLPDWADGTFIASSNLPGRAVANLRQPNHLASLLLWGLVALVPVAQKGRWFNGRAPWPLSVVLGGGMVLALVLTGSRTGAMGILILAIWGGVDRRLEGRVRNGLLVSPLVYLAGWSLMVLWAHQSGQFFGGEARAATGSDVSASRFGLWRDTVGLILAHPWQGVGFGEFTMAWMLTPFPQRPTAWYDNAHNLPLHLAVELGLPAALLLLVLLVHALRQAAERAWQVEGDEGASARAMFVMLPVIGLHSLLEYPLWYNYFLLPTAWAWGICLRQPQNLQPGRASPRFGTVAVGLAMIAGSLWLQWDYRSIAAIYLPSDNTLTNQQRIERGQTSLMFSHLADYAAAFSAAPSPQALNYFASAAPVALEPSMMEAWAEALNQTGKTDQARYLAERIREFHDPSSKAFFAPCHVAALTPKPFQCEPSKLPHTWKEFASGG